MAQEVQLITNLSTTKHQSIPIQIKYFKLKQKVGVNTFKKKLIFLNDFSQTTQHS